MAGIPLGLHRGLFPWAQAGVQYLLCEDATALDRLRERAREQGRTEQENAGSVPAAASGRATRAERSGWVAARNPIAAPPAAAAWKKEKNTSSVPPAVAAVPCAAERSTARSCGCASSDGTRLPVRAFAQWPPAWQTLFSRTPKNPVLVWSYPELADDLCGRGDKARGDALRSLFAELALPRGSHAFWPFAPLSETGESNTAFDPVFFFSGIHELRARTVLLLCETPPKELDLQGVGIFQPVIRSGIRYVRLYSSRCLVDDLYRAADRRSRLVGFLKQLCR